MAVSAVVGLTLDHRVACCYIFLGPPGAGKGTQAAQVSEKLNIPAIATGNMFREAMTKNSKLGKDISQFVNSGFLVPDRLTNAVLTNRIDEDDCQNGFILDGYPRSLEQAIILEEHLAKTGRQLTTVFYFKVEPLIVVERMAHRRICKDCGHPYNTVSQPSRLPTICDKCSGLLIQRADDHPEAIAKRLAVYEQTTKPLLSFYEDKGLLSVVSASQSVSDVNQSVFNALLQGAHS